MSDWKKESLSNLCLIKGGKRLPAGQDFAAAPTPFPYIRVTNMVNGGVDDSDLKYVPIEIEPKIRNYKISKDDLYVTIAGTLGKFGKIPTKLDNAQLTENAAKLCHINTDRIDKNYLYYFLNSENTQSQIYREIGVGGGVPKLALHRIETLKVIYPNLPKQQKITKVLATCDKVISDTENAIAKYQDIKQGMMTDLFTRGIGVNTGKLRPSYQEKPELYKQSELGLIPKDWGIVPLEELLVIASGRDYKHLSNGDIPVYGTGGYMLSVNDYLYEGESVGIGRKGTIDKPVFLTGKFWTVDTLFYTHSFKECIPKFIYLIFQTINWYNYNEASGVPSLSKTTIGKIGIQKPSMLEQVEITNLLSKCDEKIQTEKDTLKKYQQIKAGLMQDLLTGKVQVQTDDVA